MAARADYFIAPEAVSLVWFTANSNPLMLKLSAFAVSFQNRMGSFRGGFGKEKLGNSFFCTNRGQPARMIIVAWPACEHFNPATDEQVRCARV